MPHLVKDDVVAHVAGGGVGVSAKGKKLTLSHVSDGESAEGRVLRVGLDAKRLLRDELDDGGVPDLMNLGAASWVLPVRRSISVF